MNGLAVAKETGPVQPTVKNIVSRSIINGVVEAIEESVENQAALLRTLRRGLDSGLPAASNVADVLLFHARKAAGLSEFLRRELGKEAG